MLHTDLQGEGRSPRHLQPPRPAVLICMMGQPRRKAQPHLTAAPCLLKGSVTMLVTGSVVSWVEGGGQLAEAFCSWSLLPVLL